jgi:SOS response regulatory protein OraA/RecX
MSDAAFEAAASSLRHADRSRAELDERLARSGHDAVARDAALARLEELGWLDDARTAAARAAALAGRGYGDAYIGAELTRRGLPVDEALAQLDPEPERAARFAARGRAWLSRRGFDLDSVPDFAADRPAG